MKNVSLLTQPEHVELKLNRVCIPCLLIIAGIDDVLKNPAIWITTEQSINSDGKLEYTDVKI